MFLPKFAAHATPFKLSHFASRSQQHWQHIRQTFNNLNASSSGASSSGAGGSVGAGSGPAGAGGAKWHAGSRAGGWGYQNHGRLVTQAGTSSQDASTRANDDDDRDDPLAASSAALIRCRNGRPVAPRWTREDAMSSGGRRRRSLSSSGFVLVEAGEGGAGERGEVMSLRMQARYLHAFHGAKGTDAEDGGVGSSSGAYVEGPSRPRRRRLSTSATVTRSPPASGSKRRRASLSDLSSTDGSRPRLSRSLSTEAAPSASIPDSLPPTQLPTLHASTTTRPRRSQSLSSPRSSSPSPDWKKRIGRAIVNQDSADLDALLSQLLSQPHLDALAIDSALFGLLRTQRLSPPSTTVDPFLEAHSRLADEDSATPSTSSYLLYSLARRSVDLCFPETRAALDAADAKVSKELAEPTGVPEMTWTAGGRAIIALPPAERLQGEHPLLAVQRIVAELGVEESKKLQPAALEVVLAALANQPVSSRIEGLETAPLAVELFACIEATAPPTRVAFGSLIQVLAKAGDLEGAKEVYEGFCAARPTQGRTSLSTPDGENIYHGELARPSSEPLEAMVKACFVAGDTVAALDVVQSALGDEVSAREVKKPVVFGVVNGLIEARDSAAAGRWFDQLVRGEVPFKYGPQAGELLNLLDVLALHNDASPLNADVLDILPRTLDFSDPRFVNVATRLAACLHRVYLASMKSTSEEVDETLARVLGRLAFVVDKGRHDSHHFVSARSLDRLSTSVRQVLRGLVDASRFPAIKRAFDIIAVESVQHGREYTSHLRWLYRALSDSRATVSLAERLSLMSPPLLKELSFIERLRIVEDHVKERPESAQLDVTQWAALLTCGATVEMLGNRAASAIGWGRFSSLVEEYRASGVDASTAIDGNLIAFALRRSGTEAVAGLLSPLDANRQVPVSKKTQELVEKLHAEGEAFLAESLSAVRERATSPTPTEQTIVASEQPVASEQLTATVAASDTDGSAHSDPASALFSPGPATQQSSPASPTMSAVSSLEPPPFPDAVSVPHPPVRGIDEYLSEAVTRLHCTRHSQTEVKQLWTSCHSAIQDGRYLHPVAAARMVEMLGWEGMVDVAREMYLYAHVALSAMQMPSQMATAAWIEVENSMIVALARSGALEEIGFYKQRLIDAGEAPSADAYAAMIQHANETTDDANVALAYFDEATRLKVPFNTFLCNTIISKLSKARRAPAALEIYNHMKLHDIPRNSVTYGATINACCRTGDAASAEALFEEMVSSPGYKARVPPYNTMIQFYVNVQPNRERVLYYFDAMLKKNVYPTEHTYNMLMQAYAFIEPADPASMRDVFNRLCNDRSVSVTGSHWATLINAVGCVEKDLDGAVRLFDSIGQHPSTRRNVQTRSRATSARGSYRMPPRSAPRLPDAICYEALFNVFLALHHPDLIAAYVDRMSDEGIHMTAYVVNTLIKGHALAGQMDAGRTVFESLSDPPPGHAARFNRPSASNNRFLTSFEGEESGKAKPGDPVYREPSCYETMIRAELGVGAIERAEDLVRRMEARAYPLALIHRVRKLIRPSPEQPALPTEQTHPLSGYFPPQSPRPSFDPALMGTVAQPAAIELAA